MDSLKDKVVIITGASAGIGKATAIEFAKAGAWLSITGRNAEKLSDTVKLCIEAGADKSKVLPVPGDLTKKEDIKNIVDKTIQQYGTVNVLVNNAGAYFCKKFAEITDEEFDWMFTTNFKGAFWLSQACMPYLLQNKGNIVNVSSSSSLRPDYNGFGYSMAKAALDHMTQCLALEYAPKNVRVNAVHPSYTETDGFVRTESQFGVKPEDIPQLFKVFETAVPLGRMAKAKEVATVIVFLASDAASFVTGVKLPVDGAETLVFSEPKE